MTWRNSLTRMLGWPATIFYGDVSSFDRWRWLRRHIQRGSQRTLDAGCGSGAYTMYAARVGNEAIGLSMDAAALSRARERARLLDVHRVQFQECDLRELDKVGTALGVFDQVVCLETLEHIKNDHKLLRDLARLLRPGGRFLLTTPYLHYRRLLGDALAETENGGHVRWGYTHDELRALLNEVGIHVTCEEYVSGWVSQKLINLHRRLQSYGAVVSGLVVMPLRLFQLGDRWITRWLKYPYLSVAVVGVRREP